ncbi:MAG: hypothetical protein QM715_16960 [Nibricoccus sp.]
MSLISTNEIIEEGSQRSEVSDRLEADFASSSIQDAWIASDQPSSDPTDGISDARLYLAAMTYFFSAGR